MDVTKTLGDRRLANIEGERRGAAGAKGGGGTCGEDFPLLSQLVSLGSVMSSPSGVQGRAPATNAFSAYFWAEMEMGQVSGVMGQMGHHFWMGHVGHGSLPVTH